MPPIDEPSKKPPLEPDTLEDFARQVIGSVGSQGREADLIAVSNWLEGAVLKPDVFDVEEVIAELNATGLSASKIIDFCIPEVARRAGKMWVEDKATFAKVTLASTHLYSLCKRLSEQCETCSETSKMPVISVVTAPDEQHMIGAVVLASQLRRKGCSVQVLSGMKQQEIVSHLVGQRFHAVLISCAGRATLDNAVGLISRIRSEIDGPPRLVIGGAIELTLQLNSVDTGADLVTSDLSIALAGLVSGAGQSAPTATQ